MILILGYVCNQAEERVSSSYRDMIGGTRLKLLFHFPMHQDGNCMRQVHQCALVWRQVPANIQVYNMFSLLEYN